MEESLCEQSVSELQTQLGTWLEQRTGGLVRNARVEVIEGRLIVHGFTESEHIREVMTLALAVLLGAIRAHRWEIRVERLEVVQPTHDHPYYMEVSHEMFSDGVGNHRSELAAGTMD